MPNRADNFNRANGTLAGSTPSDGGTAWVSQAAGWSITSNVIGSGGSASRAVLDAGVADVDVAVTIASAASPFRSGPLLRAADANNYIVCRGNGASYSLDKVVAGGAVTNIGSDGTHTPTTGDRIRVNAVGSTIKVYLTRGGVETLIIGPVTETAGQTTTTHGVYSGFSSQTLDDFAITDLTGGSTPVGADALHYYREHVMRGGI